MRTPNQKTWAEIDALRDRLSRQTVARRQSRAIPREALFVSSMFGGRPAEFVDARGRPIK